MICFVILIAVIVIAKACSGGEKVTIQPKTVNFTTPSGKMWNLFIDMLKQPHLLIAGCSGSGKSVAINGLISTLMYRFPFDQANGAQLVLIDPKRVELSAYYKLPHTIAYASGFNPSAWLAALNKTVKIMDDRYTYMERNRMKKYNKGDLYVIIDEWANVYKNGGKDAYKAVLRLTSEGRAARVHLIMATQVPKATIIPTEIRENFDARLCLRTANSVQSRVIMDSKGCEDLPRYGMGYYIKPQEDKLYNIPYVQQEELDSLVEWWDEQKKRNHIR